MTEKVSTTPLERMTQILTSTPIFSCPIFYNLTTQHRAASKHNDVKSKTVDLIVDPLPIIPSHHIIKITIKSASWRSVTSSHPLYSSSNYKVDILRGRSLKSSVQVHITTHDWLSTFTEPEVGLTTVTNGLILKCRPIWLPLRITVLL